MVNLLADHNSYIDIDKISYDEDTLRFLRKKLDEFTIELFRLVIKTNASHEGLVKTRLDNYQTMRKRYDASFLILEAQGFIEKREVGPSTPYYVTNRGRQLITLLKQENTENK